RGRRAAVLRLAAAGLAAALLALFLGRRGEDPPRADPGATAGLAPEQPVREHGSVLASLTSEYIEMRSGPVRLILLTGGGRAGGEGAGTTSREESR
ncbi:MAG: hypothetical protein AB1726_17760, partial [Planctomycetota bacterium]